MPEASLVQEGLSESAIQRHILDNLLWRKIVAWRSQAIPVPIRRGREIVGLRKADPHTVGIPDIMCVLEPDGRLVGIEVKTKTGKQRPGQAEWAEKLRKAGALYVLARSWEDVANAIGIDV